MDEVFGSSYYKTKICINIAKNNTCKREKCFFAHSQDELREKPDLGKTKLCVKILKKGGKCTDENCTYAHSKDQLKTDNYKGLIKTKKCWFHAKNCCSNADKCRFAHGDDELRAFNNEASSQTNLNYRNVESIRKIKPSNSLYSEQSFVFPPPPPPPVHLPSSMMNTNSNLLQNDISDENKKSSVLLHYNTDCMYKNCNISKNHADNEQQCSIDLSKTEHNSNTNDSNNAYYNFEKENSNRTNDSNIDTSSDANYNNNLSFIVMNTTCKQNDRKNSLECNYNESNCNRNTANDISDFYGINCYKISQNEYFKNCYSDNVSFYVHKLSSLEPSNDYYDENVLDMNVNQNINGEQGSTINQQKQVDYKTKCANNFINSCNNKDLNEKLRNLNSNNFLSENKIKEKNIYNLPSFFTSSDNKCTCTFLSGSHKVHKDKHVTNKNDNSNISSIFEVDNNFINYNDDYYINSSKIRNNFFDSNEYDENKSFINDLKVNDIIKQNNDTSYFPQNTFDCLSSCNLSSSLSNFLFPTSSGVCSCLSSSVSSPSFLFNSAVMHKLIAKEQEDICDKSNENFMSYEKNLENSLDTSLSEIITGESLSMVTHNAFSTLKFSSLTNTCPLARNALNFEEEQCTMNSFLQNSNSTLLSMPHFCVQKSSTSLINSYSSTTSEFSSHLASYYPTFPYSKLNQKKNKKKSKVLSPIVLFSDEENTIKNKALEDFYAPFIVLSSVVERNSDSKSNLFPDNFSETSLLCENRDNFEHVPIKRKEDIEEQGSTNMRNSIIYADKNYLQNKQDDNSLIPTDTKHEICDFCLPLPSSSSVCTPVINNYNSSNKKCDTCSNSIFSPNENNYLDLGDIIYKNDYDGNLFSETPTHNMVHEEENDSKVKLFADIFDPLSQCQNYENSIENSCNNKGNMCLNGVSPLSIICGNKEKVRYSSLIDSSRNNNDNIIIDCGIDNVKLENNICDMKNTKINDACESDIMLPPTAAETFMLDNVKFSFSSVSSPFLFTSLSNNSASSPSSSSSLLLSPTLMTSFPLQTSLFSSSNLFNYTSSFTDKLTKETITDKSIPYSVFELNSSPALISSSSLSNYFPSSLLLSNSSSATSSQVSKVFSSTTFISSSVPLSEKLPSYNTNFPFPMSWSFSECLSYNSTQKSSLKVPSQLNNFKLEPINKCNACKSTCINDLSKDVDNTDFVEHEINYGSFSNLFIDNCQGTQFLNNSLFYDKTIVDEKEKEKVGNNYYNAICKNNICDTLKSTFTSILNEKDVSLNKLKLISENKKTNIIQTNLTELNGNNKIIIDKNEHFHEKYPYKFEKKEEIKANMNDFVNKSNISDSILHSCCMKNIGRKDESGKENNEETEFVTLRKELSTEGLRNYWIKKEVAEEFCDYGAVNDSKKLINNANNILLLQRNKESNNVSAYEDVTIPLIRENSFISVDTNLSSILTTHYSSSSSSFLELNNFEFLNDQKNKPENAEVIQMEKAEVTNSLKNENSISIVSTNPCSPSIKEESELNYSRFSNIKYMNDTDYSIKNNEIIDLERNNTEVHPAIRECYANINCSVTSNKNNCSTPRINKFKRGSIIDKAENEDFNITRELMICDNFEYKSNNENNNKSCVIKYNTGDASKIIEKNNDSCNQLNYKISYNEINSNSRNNEDVDYLDTINDDYYIFLLNSKNKNNINAVDVNYFSNNISLNYPTEDKDMVNNYYFPDYNSKKAKYYYDCLFEDNGKSDNYNINESITNFKNFKFQKAGYSKKDEKDKNFNLYFLPQFLLD